MRHNAIIGQRLQFAPPPEHGTRRPDQQPFHLPENRTNLHARHLARVSISAELESIHNVPHEMHIPEPIPEYQSLGNPNLPAAYKEAEIIDALLHNQITIIAGPTGSGKTTQTTQFALKAGLTPRSSQPRRLAASETAERIQQELNDKLGVINAAGLSGFQTQERSTITHRTKASQITDGIQLMYSLEGELSDGESLTIIDEVHEENQNISAIEGLEIQRVKKDPNHRVAFMSATLNATGLADFVEKETGKRPPIIEIEGRQFNVNMESKPKWDAVQTALHCVNVAHPKEDILIFASGTSEISDIINGIYKGLSGEERARTSLESLHARMTEQEQKFALRPTEGRKIIVATEVAQTSITIPGIGVVIDTGQARQVRLDENGHEGLFINNISQAECYQRAGRTGRVEKDGFYYLVKPTKNDEFVPLEKRELFQEAEILRTNFDRLTLRFAGAEKRLRDLPLPTPIPRERLTKSERTLREVGAIDENGEITELGKKMNKYPLSITSARMMVAARKQTPQVRAYLAAIVSSLEVGGLPYYVDQNGYDWSTFTSETSSDMLAQLDFFIEAQGKSVAQLRLRDLDVKNVQEAQKLYRKVTRVANTENFVLKPPTQEEYAIIKECIYAGMTDYLYQFTSKIGRQALYKLVGGKEIPRSLSNRSFVKADPGGDDHSLLLGDAYTIEVRKKGGNVEKPILTNATVVDDPEALGRAAPEKAAWTPDGHAWRNGKMFAVERQTIAGIKLQNTRERPAPPSKKVREAVIEKALRHPGFFQRMLRDIKAQTEQLNHLSKHQIKMLDQKTLEKWVRDAAPNDVTDPGIIDLGLRDIMLTKEISLDYFVSPEQHAQILADAPQKIEVNGMELKLKYRNGVPTAQYANLPAILAFEEEVTLPDGRIVHFTYNRRSRTIKEIKTTVKRLRSTRERRSA